MVQLQQRGEVTKVNNLGKLQKILEFCRKRKEKIAQPHITVPGTVFTTSSNICFPISTEHFAPKMSVSEMPKKQSSLNL